jgi:Limonene-1,2-epoxide hydrolase catalytic domain
MLVARYRSDAVGRDKSVAYQHEYIGIFRFTDGKITLWREYNNPEVAHAAAAKFADDAPAVSAWARPRQPSTSSDSTTAPSSS